MFFVSLICGTILSQIFCRLSVIARSSDSSKRVAQACIAIYTIGVACLLIFRFLFTLKLCILYAAKILAFATHNIFTVHSPFFPYSLALTYRRRLCWVLGKLLRFYNVCQELPTIKVFSATHTQKITDCTEERASGAR